MTRQQRRQLEELHDRDLSNFNDHEDSDNYVQDVLHGRARAEISHAGEALSPDAVNKADAALMRDLRPARRCVFFFFLWSGVPTYTYIAFVRQRYAETRTRRNRTLLQVKAFEVQLEQMVDVYLAFSLAAADVEEGLPSTCKTPEDAELQETHDVLVVDMFCTHNLQLFYSFHFLILL